MQCMAWLKCYMLGGSTGFALVNRLKFFSKHTPLYAQLRPYRLCCLHTAKSHLGVLADKHYHLQNQEAALRVSPL